MLLQADFLTYIATTVNKIYRFVIYYLPINNSQDCNPRNEKKVMINLEIKIKNQQKFTNIYQYVFQPIKKRLHY